MFNKIIIIIILILILSFSNSFSDDINKLSELAKQQYSSKKIKESEESFLKVINLTSDKYGFYDEKTLDVYFKMGNFYKITGEYKKSKDYYSTAKVISEKINGLNDSLTRTINMEYLDMKEKTDPPKREEITMRGNGVRSVVRRSKSVSSPKRVSSPTSLTEYSKKTGEKDIKKVTLTKTESLVILNLTISKLDLPSKLKNDTRTLANVMFRDAGDDYYPKNVSSITTMIRAAHNVVKRNGGLGF